VTIIHRGLETGLAGVGSGVTDQTLATNGPATQAQTQTQSQTQTQPGAGNASSEVEITSAAQLLSSIEQQLAGVPEVNQSRVTATQQALNDGSYQIDSSRIADGLLAAQRFATQAAVSSSGSGSQSNPLQAFTTTAQLE
jgi:negative regulator of flagellin synthesis FlgM